VTQESIERLTAELKESYQGAVSAKDGTLMLVRLQEVHFPPGCQPESTEALVALDPTKAKPDFYIRVVPATRGTQPQYGTAVIGGDNWCTYSFNLRWTEDHTALQFVEGMLRRFA
jgi:hypothetical protein